MTGEPPRKRRRARLPALGIGAAVLVVACLLLAVFGPVLAPHGEGTIVSRKIFAPMSAAFPLGTDYLGRDMLSRVLYGARFTIGVALPAALLASGAGTLLGMVAAVRGGPFDTVLSRGMDVIISLPTLIFSLVVVAALGSSFFFIVMSSSVIYTPGSYRITRSVAVDVSAADFVKAARARGEGWFAIMLG